MVNPFAFCLFVSVSLRLLHLASPLVAKDFGTQGVVFPIEEADPIELIHIKLKGMEARGELGAHNKELQKKTRASVERPHPVEGITRVTTARTFYFDPTYIVAEDLKDHTGKVFAVKGTKLNPLETVSLSHTLLFFDGDDVDQKAFVVEKLQGKPNFEQIKLILVKGAPLALSKELNVSVYFDQGGILTEKLKIKHVPALVMQEGLRLRIEETELKEATDSKVNDNTEGKKTP